MCQANLNIRDKIYKHKWDLLDGQYYFRKVQEFREKDGVHWVRNQISRSLSKTHLEPNISPMADKYFSRSYLHSLAGATTEVRT